MNTQDPQQHFRWIESQTSGADRAALISIREAVCRINGTYRYLEVGSHLGGSLQPHVIDPRCVTIYSIDPRPASQPDERWQQEYEYQGNSTQRMLEGLAEIPGADLAKLQTFESSSWELAPDSVPAEIEFAFIDGEHTETAVFQDYMAVRRFMAPTGVLAFHDCFVTPSALLRIRSLLDRHGPDRLLHFPESDVAAIVINSPEIAGSLITQGWTEGLPFGRLALVKRAVSRRYPKLWARLKRLRG